MRPEKKSDVIVTNHGSLVGFDLKTAEARAWVKEHVSTEDAQYLGNSLMVEPRCAEQLRDGMSEAGLVVE